MPACFDDKHLLRNYIGYLFDARGLKAGSVKRRMACLKAMFHWLEEDEILAANPFRRVALGSVSDHHPEG